MQKRVMFVDDHPVFRQGLRRALGGEFNIVGEAADGAQAIEQAVHLRPDVVVMDVALPGVNGVAATRKIKEQLPGTQVVILTAGDDDDTLFGAVEAGASAFVPKDENIGVLIEAVKHAGAGHGYLPPRAAGRLMSATADLMRAARLKSESMLSDREVAVLRLLALGKSYRQIAGELFLSERTVGNDVLSLYNKLGIHNRSSAVVYAIKQGLVSV